MGRRRMMMASMTPMGRRTMMMVTMCLRVVAVVMMKRIQAWRARVRRRMEGRPWMMLP
jgi:hypothetical protein